MAIDKKLNQNIWQHFDPKASLPIRRHKGQKLAEAMAVDELKALIKTLGQKNDQTSWDLIAI